MKVISKKKKFLEFFKENIKGFINGDIKFNLKNMKHYYYKETIFISEAEEYSRKI